MKEMGKFVDFPAGNLLPEPPASRFLSLGFPFPRQKLTVGTDPREEKLMS